MNILNLKHLLLTALFCMLGFWGYVQDTIPPAQQNSIPPIQIQHDTLVPERPVQKKTPSLRRALPDPVKDTVVNTNQADTGLTKRDTALSKKDTTSIVSAIVPFQKDTLWHKLLNNPFLPAITNPVYLVIKERQPVTKDEIFYLIAGLLLFLAFIKLVFPKYFRNIFRLFFQPSFRQKQTREQLSQSNLPSLLYNLFFVLSGGAYIALLIQHLRLVKITAE